MVAAASGFTPIPSVRHYLLRATEVNIGWRLVVQTFVVSPTHCYASGLQLELPEIVAMEDRRMRPIHFHRELRAIGDHFVDRRMRPPLEK